MVKTSSGMDGDVSPEKNGRYYTLTRGFFIVFRKNEKGIQPLFP